MSDYGFSREELLNDFISADRLFLYGIDEVNVKLSDGKRLNIHECEEGYDWTLYDSEFHIIDGGIYDEPDETLKNVYEYLAEEYGFAGLSVLHTEEEFEENLDVVMDSYIDNLVVKEMLSSMVLDKMGNMEGSEITTDVYDFIVNEGKKEGERWNREKLQKVADAAFEQMKDFPDLNQLSGKRSKVDVILYDHDALWMKAICAAFPEKMIEVECGWGMIELAERKPSLNEKIRSASGSKSHADICKENEEISR